MKIFRKRPNKNKIFLCHDNNGVRLHPGDYVLLHSPDETITSHISMIYWNALDGAYVHSHPVHIKMGLSVTRSLSSYIGYTCVKSNSKAYSIHISTINNI